MWLWTCMEEPNLSGSFRLRRYLYTVCAHAHTVHYTNIIHVCGCNVLCQQILHFYTVRFSVFLHPRRCRAAVLPVQARLGECGWVLLAVLIVSLFSGPRILIGLLPPIFDQIITGFWRGGVSDLHVAS